MKALRINREQFTKVAGILFLAAALVAPFSTALLNVTCILGFIAWLLGLSLRQLHWIISQSFVWLLIAIVLLLCFSVFWSTAPTAEALNILGKYRKLLYCLAIAGICFAWPVFKGLFLKFLYFSLSLMALFSVAVALELPGMSPLDPYQGAIFMKSHITEGFLLGILTLLNGALVLFGRHQTYRFLGIAGLTLASVVAFYLTNGRTGFLSVGLAFVMIGCYWVSNKKSVWILIATLLIAVSFVFSSSDRVQNRVTEGINDLHSYVQEGNAKTSMGLRADFWISGLKMVAQAPLLGHGAGSFKEEMKKQISANPNDAEKVITANPHNDFILLAVQTGLIGLTLLLVLLWRIYRYSGGLPQPQSLLIRGLIVIYAAGALFNSYLLDFTEGTVFVLTLSVLLAGNRLATLKESENA